MVYQVRTILYIVLKFETEYLVCRNTQLSVQMLWVVPRSRSSASLNRFRSNVPPHTMALLNRQT